MTEPNQGVCTAFAAGRLIATGPVPDVARTVREHLDADEDMTVLVFDDETSQPVELDLRGDADEVSRRYPHVTPGGPSEPETAEPRRGPGRPKLGVVGREVTLLPRHWAWLRAQRGGASVTLRRLVDQARAETAGADEARLAQDSTYRFMVATVGDAPGFEEATRALFASDIKRFEEQSQGWPPDLRDHCRRLARPAMTPVRTPTPNGDR